MKRSEIVALRHGFNYLVINHHGTGELLSAMNQTVADDADFLKIRNITIGYDLPEYLTEKVGISKISLRFQINDPKALWIKNNAGIDPETLGIRKQASYMFGVNLSL